jgi:hypothetical protein
MANSQVAGGSDDIQILAANIMGKQIRTAYNSLHSSIEDGPRDVSKYYRSTWTRSGWIIVADFRKQHDGQPGSINGDTFLDRLCDHFSQRMFFSKESVKFL